MKNKLKQLAMIGSVLLLSLTMLASCGSLSDLLSGTAKPKDFSASGLTITLTENFAESEVVSQTAVYQSRDVVVSVLKEEKTLFQQAGVSTEISLQEYAEMIIAAHALDSEVYEKDSLVCFDYEKEANGKEYKYFACVYRGKDAYWLVQFCVEAKDYENKIDQLTEWAKTVRFDEAE